MSFVRYWGTRRRELQNLVLVVPGVVFYGWITPWWVALLYVSATLDFVMGQLLVRSPAYRRLWLAISLVGNLGLLVYFKYFGFFVENVALALSGLGFDVRVGTLRILLPAGISFYVFQTVSYLVDVSRGELRPRRSWLDYLAFVTFSPQLVAGPIERASNLLPQLEVRRRFSLHDLGSGFGLASWGAFQKIVVADTLAPWVDKVFAHEDPAGPLVWAASTAFMVQLYADFSGYTDLARGTARMLDIHLVRNFDEPWLATTTPEFWQRWHVSLSTWIRDYVLTPLLGDAAHVSRLRFVGAVTFTMLIMGAWHGAGWNYLAFGLFHATCILGYVAITRNLPAWAGRIPYGRVWARVHIFVIGNIGSLLFREPSLARFVRHVTKSPFWGSTDEWRAAVAILTLTAVLSLPFLVEHHARRHVLPRLAVAPQGSVHRLNATEYDATLGVLLGTGQRPALRFPADGVRDGFGNHPADLPVTPVLLDLHEQAIDDVLDELFLDVRPPVAR